MKIIFTRNKGPLSKLIRWISEEPVSHMAIVFDDKILFQSNLLGCRIYWYASFLHHNTVVYEIEYNYDLMGQEQIYQSIIGGFDGKDYDYGALLYFMWRGFLYKMFNIALPKKNAWGSPDRFLCDELAHVLPEPLRIDSDLDLVTPYEVYLILKKRVDSGKT